MFDLFNKFELNQIVSPDMFYHSDFFLRIDRDSSE